MVKRMLLVSALASVMLLCTCLALAADPESAPKRVQMQEQVQIYGSQLMTQQERNEYHMQMRAAKSAQEREQVRKEHHKRMQERAKLRGVTLPDEMPAIGSGMGSGMGFGGGGMGSGRGGMGSGGGGRGR